MAANLLTPRTSYKPFEYPWAYDAYKLQQQMHWLPDEVSLADDVKDWKNKLDDKERNLLTQIFRFFTQADLDVAGGYIHKYMPVFAHKPEITMMMASFANMEAIHIDAYSKLVETIGLPDSEYNAFLDYAEMKAKHEYLESTNFSSTRMEPSQIAKDLAVYSAFTEGLQLFSSFAILLNFPRHGKMNGMGQIVSWSQRDESLHVESMIKLFKTFIKENKKIWDDELKKELYKACTDMVKLEDKFIDLAFKMGSIEGLTASEVKKYIRYIADRRLLQLGLKTQFDQKKNPLPWVEDAMNSTVHTNFFENTATEYAKASTSGTWDEVWDK